MSIGSTTENASALSNTRNRGKHEKCHRSIYNGFNSGADGDFSSVGWNEDGVNGLTNNYVFLNIIGF